MAIAWMAYAWKDGPEDSNERYVYLALADNANEEGFAWPSLPTIAEKTRLSESTVRRSVLGLEKGGWLTVFRGNGAGNKSQYRLQRVSGRKLSDGPKKGVTVEEKGVRLKNPPHPLIGGTVKNRQLTFPAVRGAKNKPFNPGAEKQRQIPECERRLIWESMSPAFRKVNPWPDP